MTEGVKETGEKIGIVLGGGGTLGDFQVGALKYLYSHGRKDGNKERGVLPHIDCVCGTSIGAINAAMVATGASSADKLEAYWCKDVLTGDDLIPQHEWSEKVAPLFNAIIAGGSGIRALWTFIRNSRWFLREDLLRALGDLERMFTTVTTKRSFYKSDSLRRRLREIEDLEKALTSGITFRFYATNLKTGEYTCFSNRSPCPSEGDKRSQTHKVSILCDSREKLIEGALASAALPGIFPPVPVNDNYYIDGFVRENVPVRGALHCDKIYAILCLPLLIPSKNVAANALAEDGYTGCLFDIRPEDWGISNKDWCKADWLDIANRAAAIALDEITDGDLTFGGEKKGDNLIIIDPLVPVHGIADLHIGLIKINMDQGYMRAFDLVNAPKAKSAQSGQLTEEITARRVAIWKEEHKLIEDWSDVIHRSPTRVCRPWRVFLPRRILGCSCDMDVVDTTILNVIRQLKKELKRSIDKRLDICGPDSLPDDYKRMYQRWEPHNWDIESPTRQPITATPWDRLDLGDMGSEVIQKENQP